MFNKNSPETRNPNHTAGSPLAYYGSKKRLSPHLIPLFPAHRCFVEVFGGSGALLFAKPVSRVEVLNDINGDLVHFYRTLRGPHGPILVRQLSLTPHSRTEHACCKRDASEATGAVEKARRFCVCIGMSYSGIYKDAYSTSKTKALARTWAKRVDRMPWAAERLRDVQIEALDFRRLIPKFDSPETLFYCDPPYLHSTRTANAQRKGCRKYTHEMTERDHENLLSVLLTIKGKVMLSGYSSRLYDDSLQGWRRWTKKVQCVSATTNNRPSIDREEIVWMNF